MFGHTARLFDAIPLRNSLEKIKDVCQQAVVDNGNDWPKEVAELLKEIALEAIAALDAEQNCGNEFSKNFTAPSFDGYAGYALGEKEYYKQALPESDDRREEV